MDPSMDPPPVTFEIPPAAAEPQFYITSNAANPTPSHTPNGNHNHPPYADMITAAITALKEKNGSSRQAIAKYIEGAYSGLPSNHPALLTHHLKRLKNSGQLVMVKHSYMISRSVPISSSFAATGNENALPSGPKRGPGRPPKSKVEIQPINVGVGPESVLVSLGLVDGTSSVVKRGRGRPPKAKTGSVGGKRGRGRPPTPKLLPVLVAHGGLKRRSGRPPRTGPIGLEGASRPRGRPKKDGSVMKLAGRLAKNAAVAAAGVGLAAVGGGVLPEKQRGRPPRVSGLKKPRKLTGRPLGRPRKVNMKYRVIS
ncbi:winged-helix DNA-binding transcription factor family protein [Actinidia rufa]|uniref:Winged-helix DNA-binding transcription factor family protein n=1 Tax=Actinidia rufa TaxID=165716 RepID=A0A7J0DGI7_9ERIC|nr:winged-helix DNA-binding transcription factor family protein [Actinidia rufa]